MRIVVLFLMMATLVGCEPSPEEQARVRSALPAGCVIHSVGSYGDIRELVFVICDGRRTSSLNWMERHGKFSDHDVTVAMDGLQ